MKYSSFAISFGNAIKILCSLGRLCHLYEKQKTSISSKHESKEIKYFMGSSLKNSQKK
jgi:hypothetical protein